MKFQYFQWPKDKKKIVKYYKSVDKSKIIDKMKYILPSAINKDYINAAEKIIRDDIYMIPPYGSTSYPKSINWTEDPKNTRSFMRLLHGHFFINDLVAAYKKSKKVEYLLKGFEIIKDWILNNPYNNPAHKMAWHDETTASRLMTWISFFNEARKLLNDNESELFLKSIFLHVKLLSSSNFYSKNTNHGMFQDQALIIYSDYFWEFNNSKNINKLACSRMKEYFDFIFSSEGIHLEHSPKYHQMIAQYLKKYGDYLNSVNSPFSKELINLYNKASKFATYIIKPDGYLPQIGDTDRLRARSGIWINNPYYRYAVTKGREGRVPLENDKVFPKSGYAIFRDDWQKKEKGVYILFIAAYHVAYHKHCDDLSLWIYSNGDIIRESGPNGFDYKNKFTRYTYSSFSHNTLIVDNKSLPRTDGKYKSVRLTEYKVDKNISRVTGINERFEGVKHIRTVEYFKDTKNITITDNIKSEKEHEYKLLWNLADDIKPVIKGTKILLYRGKVLVMRVSIETNTKFSIRTIRGQVKPFVLGWICEKFCQQKPTSALIIGFTGRNVSIKTKFTIMN
ncbi:alginate lyase family protein [Oceanirhabdus seepicola]|uniref:Alginate lyase family protein n=1 Tax=Oceanirhabdus seepicola TaxID=2828781 RepID=A0A9J6NXX1_9CLOT|nr:alginate lyase family protein [Oceanirhabdus seepicola]MCM1989298.1 alginate lyase family protein [Oceanirhabdus seepicola]